MKNNLLTVLAVSAFGILMMNSCSKDNDELMPDSNDDKAVDYYDYSEHGFFINGEIKVKGYFPTDSIFNGYTKYVKRTAHYRTVDGEEAEMLFGYGLVVGISNFAKYYSDNIVYNADSTAISCNGQFELQQDPDKTYPAEITAAIDSIGQPHLVTCRTSVGGKTLLLQFRETHTRLPYSDAEPLKDDEFSI